MRATSEATGLMQTRAMTVLRSRELTRCFSLLLCPSAALSPLCRSAA